MEEQKERDGDLVFKTDAELVSELHARHPRMIVAIEDRLDANRYNFKLWYNGSQSEMIGLAVMSIIELIKVQPEAQYDGDAGD